MTACQSTEATCIFGKASDEIFPYPPLLTSHDSSWRNIYFEYHYQGAIDISETSDCIHAVCINLSRQVRQTDVWMDGQHQRVIMVSPGTVGIKPAGVNHRFASQDDSEFIIIKLKPEFLTHIGQDWRDSESLELVPAIHSQSDPLLLQLGLALKGEIESGYPGGRMYGDSIATAIAAHLLRQYSSSNLAIADDATGLTANQLQNVVNYIQTYLDLSLSLGELANLVNLSPYYFSRLFKQSTGTTPYQYISQQRVERAKQLLRQTDLMIAEVALRCGFSSQSSFSTAFRKVVSMTPGAYRKSL